MATEAPQGALHSNSTRLAWTEILPFEGRWRAPSSLGVRRRGVTASRESPNFGVPSGEWDTPPTSCGGHRPLKGRISVRANLTEERSSDQTFLLPPEQLPPRQIEHDFLAAPTNRIDADFAVDAFDLAAGDIACPAQYLRSIACDRL
jgi:hypothetical protein